MSDRATAVLGSAAILVMGTTPAFAGFVTVPEPATISLFAIGAAGAFVARQLIRRK